MKRLAGIVAIVAALTGVFATGAQAAEFEKFEVESASASLSTSQAGGHPDLTTSFRFTTNGGQLYAKARNIEVNLPPGIFGNPRAVPTCTTLEFAGRPEFSHCPQDSQVGITEVALGGIYNATFREPVFNMEAPGGAVARFGFYAKEFPVFIVAKLRPDDRGVTAGIIGAYGAAPFVEATTTFWGVPADESHDEERITVLEAAEGVSLPPGGREATIPAVPFMTNPTACDQPLPFWTTATSYQLPASPSTLFAPFPEVTGCALLGFHPETEAALTTEQGTTGSGFNYEASLPAKGLEHPNLFFDSEAHKVEVTLPEGVTINPSEAEGLGVCTEEGFAHETLDSAANQGCPENSKIGSVTASTPVLTEEAVGSLYIAKPYENPFHSLLALYMVLRVPNRGVIVKMAGKVSADEATGQLKTTFDDVPQLPASNFHLHFREGARAPLVTPPACGEYPVVSRLTPWSDPNQVVTRTNVLHVTSGPGHTPCPSGGTPPFQPGLIAGTLNNAAGQFSPFDVRLTRTDSEQEITHFSIKLPPGVTGKLAGIPFCPEAGIAAAQARQRTPHGGQEELERPSCPAASEVGHTLAGAGVGNALTYVPGKVYLAGPYNGAPISIVAITAAKAGPFDLGTVVVREALKVNPETAEVFIDATGSDPIPHIVNGIPVHLRDIRVDVDRPGFVLNPTDCEPTSTASTVLGSGTDFASEADDRPVTVTTRFQAADCASLDFKPKLKLMLRGGKTHRGGLPAFKAVLNARPGDANIGEAQVTLPSSEYLEQGHLNNVCPKSIWVQGSVPGERCPASSIYGHAKAITPLLSEPLEGPVYLRTGYGTKLPELVAALNGQEINVDVVGIIDAVHKKGSEVSRIRNTFKTVPDAPVTSFTLELKGGSKGLLVNSTNVCRGTHRALAAFTGQNGKVQNLRPELQATGCKKGGKGGGRRG